MSVLDFIEMLNERADRSEIDVPDPGNADFRPARNCLKCGVMIERIATPRHCHSWCAGGCFDKWEATQPGDKLKGAFEELESRRIFEQMLADRQCPDGHGPLVLQNDGQDLWRCPECHLAVIAGAIQ